MAEVDPVRGPHGVYDPLGLTRGPPPDSSEFQEALRRQAVEKSDEQEQQKRKRNLEAQEKEKAEKKEKSTTETEKEHKKSRAEKKKGEFTSRLAATSAKAAGETAPSPAAMPLAGEKLGSAAGEESVEMQTYFPKGGEKVEIGPTLKEAALSPAAQEDHVGEVIHHPNPPPAPHTGEKQDAPEEKVTAAPVSTGKAAGSPGVSVSGPLASVMGNLPPQIVDMFERMAGVMTVMTSSGMKETTITLNSPQFANSPFFGSQIVIREYSTAPKAFNIMLLGNPQAMEAFHGKIGSLQAAFNMSEYNFRVHRLETALLKEAAPVLERKESASHDEEKEREQ